MNDPGLCDYQFIEGTELRRCKDCGDTDRKPYTKPRKRRCPKKKHLKPKVLTKAERIALFLKAVVESAVVDGFKKLPKHKIKQRLNICKECDKFTGSSCYLCGCCVDDKVNLFNKLAHPRQKCPLKKWGKEPIE